MISTLLVVDDHEAFRGFVTMLFTGDRFRITGVAENGLDAVAAAERIRPDLVLLDIQLPDIDGFEVARRLAALADPPTVVLTSTREAADFGQRLASAPALGFVPKHELSVDVIAQLVDRSDLRYALSRP